MAVDDSKVLFSSNWDVNQIIEGDIVTVTVPAYSVSLPKVTVADISHLGLTKAPVVLAKIKDMTSDTWFLPGGGLYFNGFTPGPRVSIVATPTLIQADTLLNTAPVTVQIEYYVMTKDAVSS